VISRSWILQQRIPPDQIWFDYKSMPIEVCTFPFLLIVVEQSICNFGDGEQGGAGGEEGAVVLWEWVKGK